MRFLRILIFIVIILAIFEWIVPRTATNASYKNPVFWLYWRHWAYSEPHQGYAGIPEIQPVGDRWACGLGDTHAKIWLAVQHRRWALITGRIKMNPPHSQKQSTWFDNKGRTNRIDTPVALEIGEIGDGNRGQTGTFLGYFAAVNGEAIRWSVGLE